MSIDKYQRGLTTTAWITLLVVVGIVAWLGIKIIPIYITNGKVANAMENVKSSGPASKAGVKSTLLKRLSVDDVDIINSENFDQLAKYEKTGEGFTLTIQYSDETPLMGSMYLTVKFDKTIEVP